MDTQAHALFESLEPRRLLANFNWDGGGDGTSWEDAANWEGDVLPGPLDHVVINRSGSDPTIVFSAGDVNIYNLRCSENLTITGGRLVVFESNWMSGTLTVSGGTLLIGIEWQQLGPVSLSAGAIDGVGAFALKNTMDWTGGSLGQDAAPSGRFHVTPGATLNIHGDVNLDRVLVNNGTLNWTSGVLAIERGQLLNMAGRTIGVFAGARITAASAAAGLIVNRGVVNFAGDSEIGARYHQVSGAATTADGAITLRRGGYIDGSFTTAPGMALRCAGDSAVVALNILPGADLTLGGALEITGGRMAIKSPGVTFDTLVMAGRSLTLAHDAVIGTLTWTAGVLGGAGQVNITQVLTWSGGTLVGDADFVIDSGAELVVPGGTTLVAARRPVVVFGSMAWEGGDIQLTEELLIDGAATLGVSWGGVLVMLSPDGALTVRGALVRTGTGMATFLAQPGAAGLVVENGASLQSGGISVAGNSAIAGAWTLDPDGLLEVSNRGGEVVVDPTATFTGGGTFAIGAAPAGAPLELRGTFQVGRLRVGGRVDTDGATIEAAITELVEGGLIYGAGDFVLSASFLWTGGGFGGTGRTVVPAGGTATLSSGGTYQVQREFVNRGTVTITAGTLRVATPAGTFRNDPGSVFNLFKTPSAFGPAVVTTEGGRFDLLDGAVMNTTGGNIETGPSSPLELLGTVNKTGADSLNFLARDGAGHAGGVFNVDQGAFNITSGVHAGEFHVAAGASLRTSDGGESTPIFSPESSITGPGTLGNLFGSAEFQGVVDVGRLQVQHSQGTGGTMALLMGATKRAGAVELLGDTLLVGAATALEVTGDFHHAGGRLQMRVGGTAPNLYAHVSVGGLTLAGGPPVALEVIYWGGFEPSVGQSFDLVTSVMRSGQFGTVVLPVQPPGVIADLDYLPGLIRLNIVEA